MSVKIGEPIMAALELIGELLAIEVERVGKGGMEFVDVDVVLDDS